MPPWTSPMLSLQPQNCLIIFVGNVHKIPYLRFLLGSGRKCSYVLVLFPYDVSSVQVFPTLSQPGHAVFCVQGLRPDSVRMSVSYLCSYLADRGVVDKRRVVSRPRRASGWWGG